MITRSISASLGAVLLAMAGPSQAILISGSWDPAYGAPFTQLGWRGTTTIDVPTACLGLAGTIVNDGGACSLVTVQSAKVEFYDLTDLAAVPAMVETLDFDSAVEVSRIFVSDGEVLAFALDDTGLVASTSYLGTPGSGSGLSASFALSMDFDLASGDVLNYQAKLQWYAMGERNPSGTNDFNTHPAFVSLRRVIDPTPVPLPTTLALALAGLALLGATRRR